MQDLMQQLAQEFTLSSPVTLWEWALVLAAYAVGSISFGILVSHWFDLPDPRTVGSGNPGATNVLRSGKKMAALLTLLGDAAKGWLMTRLAFWLHLDAPMLCLLALAVFIGHLYPLYYRFRGGKGVATALGILLACSGWLGLAVLAIWIVVFTLFRISSLSALIAAALSPLLAWVITDQPAIIAIALVLAVLLIYRHQSNIRKLLAGSESRFGKS